MMTETEARRMADEFLRAKEAAIGIPLAEIPDSFIRFEAGWTFDYQGRAWVEHGDMGATLVGHGPVVILDDGRLLAGGSLDFSPMDVVRRQV